VDRRTATLRDSPAYMRHPGSRRLIGLLGFDGTPDLTEWIGKGGAVRYAFAPEGIVLYPTVSPRRCGSCTRSKVVTRRWRL
jgi:hypothetical protein